MTRTLPALEVSTHPQQTFLETSIDESLIYFVKGAWETEARHGSIVGERLVELSYESDEGSRSVIRGDDSLILAAFSRNSVEVTVAAKSHSSAETLMSHIRSVLPAMKSDSRSVPVAFTWSGMRTNFSTSKLPSLKWEEIESNYVGATRSDLETAGRWNKPPPGGRLMLWHGPPGTGKTNALRYLTGAWREWADFYFVIDPEQFLQSAAYLLDVVERDGLRDRLEGESSRWRVLVLEDSGEFLAPDAKYEQGQAISRLLNLCDGVLGQALNVLVLITTNEPVRKLPAALTRPGRLLSSTEFGLFSPDEAHAWLASHDAAVADAAGERSLADLFACLNGRQPVASENQAGF